jgi:hypothetical protein
MMKNRLDKKAAHYAFTARFQVISFTLAGQAYANLRRTVVRVEGRT